ncbi:MAG: phage shock protein A [Natronomonas sp.]|jgi:phage shock protein A
MGILSRASYAIRSKINAVLNRAENPQETLDYSYGACHRKRHVRSSRVWKLCPPAPKPCKT